MRVEPGVGIYTTTVTHYHDQGWGGKLRNISSLFLLDGINIVPSSSSVIDSSVNVEATSELDDSCLRGAWIVREAHEPTADVTDALSMYPLHAIHVERWGSLVSEIRIRDK